MNRRMLATWVIGGVAACAAGRDAWALAPDTVAGAPAGGSTAEPGGLGHSRCSHVGTKWVNARVLDMGGLQCTETAFTFHIGGPAGDASGTISQNGCPAFIETEPGHGETIQKPNYRISRAQTLRTRIQHYESSCWYLWFDKCTPSGESESTGRTVTHYEEQACPLFG